MKYDRIELTAMAMQAVSAKAVGDFRYLILCTQLMMRAGLDMATVEARIAAYARGEHGQS